MEFADVFPPIACFLPAGAAASARPLWISLTAPFQSSEGIYSSSMRPCQSYTGLIFKVDVPD